MYEPVMEAMASVLRPLDHDRRAEYEDRITDSAREVLDGPMKAGHWKMKYGTKKVCAGMLNHFPFKVCKILRGRHHAEKKDASKAKLPSFNDIMLRQSHGWLQCVQRIYDMLGMCYKDDCDPALATGRSNMLESGVFVRCQGEVVTREHGDKSPLPYVWVLPQRKRVDIASMPASLNGLKHETTNSVWKPKKKPRKTTARRTKKRKAPPSKTKLQQKGSSRGDPILELSIVADFVNEETREVEDFRGTVESSRYDSDDDETYYTIVYDDGDREEMTKCEVLANQEQ